MFDIALSEIVVIMLVALVIIGPERLPKVARSIGRTWGRVQRYVQHVKSDIENEMAIDEARQMQARIRREVDTVGNILREDGKTLEQHILQSQYRKPPMEPNASASSSQRPPDNTI